MLFPLHDFIHFDFILRNFFTEYVIIISDIGKVKSFQFPTVQRLKSYKLEHNLRKTSFMTLTMPERIL